MVIDSFNGEYRWLSNFWSCRILMYGRQYPSVENAYQAAKWEDEEPRLQFEVCTASQAKRLGRQAVLRSNWNEERLRLMAYLLRYKFIEGNSLAVRLVATGDAKLIEGNYWGDTFWGVCKGKGENHLGRLLMERRDALIQR